jgi:hypothetical protein
MSISSIFNTVVKTARLMVIGLVLVSLCAAGANAARRTYTESQEKIQKMAKATVAKLAEVGPNAPLETPGGNMAPGSRPTTEQQCILQAVTAPGGNDRSGERAPSGSALQTDPSILSGAVLSHPPLVSLAEAVPQAARILTLVGAVPSGTM